MARHIAVVSAKSKHGKMGKKMKHAHPVRRLTIEPTDNGGFSTSTEMHPVGGENENDMYSPGQTMTGAHPNFAALQKHVKGALNLKTDAEEQGPGEEPGGDPGSSMDAE